jgi:hypothetical protein
VAVILAPYGLRASLTAAGARDAEQVKRLLDEWRQFYVIKGADVDQEREGDTASATYCRSCCWYVFLNGIRHSSLRCMLIATICRYLARTRCVNWSTNHVYSNTHPISPCRIRVQTGTVKTKVK